MSRLLSRFRQLSSQRHCVWLDTASGEGKALLAGEPVRVFRAKGGSDTFARLARELTGFRGYAIGYFAYDLKNELERLPARAADDLGLPDCWFGFYDNVWVGPTEPAAPPPPRGTHSLGSWPETNGEKAFLQAVQRAKDYIGAGDIYQVNLSRRFECPVRLPSAQLYERLRTINPAPYAAYLDIGEAQILCSSPECFLRMRGRDVVTRPIKGTRPREADPNELLTSPKDQAELLMITDLERNDLGRVCEYGSVHVPELWRVETYATVHHLVATVAGRLRDGVSHLDCLRACFPGGSITGAPKIRAMEIIDELEPVARGVYCGAIGYFGPNGESEFNIAIRTVVVKDGRAYFHAGAGIVADSDPAAEHQEVLAKARGIMEALRDVGIS